MHRGRLILEHARITRPGLPAFDGNVLIEDGSIAAIQAGPLRDRTPNIQRVDCRGAALFPGFQDLHCHPLALGSALLAADCRPATAPGIGDVQRSLVVWAAANPQEPIVRGFGYDQLRLREQRHPNRLDLDQAVADRPVVLAHSSGHACVLNSAALRLAGVDASTDEPPGGYIDRDPESGAPSGLLLEMSGWVERRLGIEVPGRAERYARAANQEFLRNGVTAVTDAGHLNDARTFELWDDLVSSGAFAPRVTVMSGIAFRPAVFGTGRVSAGPLKVMLTRTAGRLTPGEEELRRIFDGAVADGIDVAVHAVERTAIELVCKVVLSSRVRAQGRHPIRVRVEHASESPAAVSKTLKAAGVSVVTQPGFIHARGDRYIAARRTEGGLPGTDLYPFRRWQLEGIPVSASSDAPYGPVSPLAGIAGAAGRRTEMGRALGASQRISVLEALKLYFQVDGSAPEASGWAALRAGEPADLVLLEEDPQQVAAQAIARIRCLMTVIGGQIAWADGSVAQ